MFFIKDYLKKDKVKKNGEENAKRNLCDGIKSAAQEWGKMSADQKAPFEKMAIEEKARLDRLSAEQ